MAFDLLQAQLVRYRSPGYRVKWAVLNAKDYGVAQNRRRVFLVGVRTDQNFEYEFPQPTHGPETVRKYIKQRDVLSHFPRWPEGEFNSEPFHSLGRVVGVCLRRGSQVCQIFFPQTENRCFRRRLFLALLHPKCGHLPKSNRPYWSRKLARNKRRDSCTRRTLRSQGVRVLRFWECRLQTQPVKCIKKLLAVPVSGNIDT